MTYGEIKAVFNKVYPGVITTDWRPYDQAFVDNVKDRVALCMWVNSNNGKKPEDDDMIVWYPSQATLDNQNEFPGNDALNKTTIKSIKDKFVSRMIAGEDPANILKDFILNG